MFCYRNTESIVCLQWYWLFCLIMPCFEAINGCYSFIPSNIVHTSNNIEATLSYATSRTILSTKSKHIEQVKVCFDFVQRTKFHEKLVRHCCWCWRGFKRWRKPWTGFCRCRPLWQPVLIELARSAQAGRIKWSLSLNA